MSLYLKEKVRETVLYITEHLVLSLASVYYFPKVPMPHCFDNPECLQMRVTDLEEVDPGSSSNPKSSPSFLFQASDSLVPCCSCSVSFHLERPSFFFICMFFDPEPSLDFSISYGSALLPFTVFHLVFEQTGQTEFHP